MAAAPGCRCGGGGGSGVEAPNGGGVETLSMAVEASGTAVATPATTWRLRVVAAPGGARCRRRTERRPVPTGKEEAGGVREQGDKPENEGNRRRRHHAVS